VAFSAGAVIGVALLDLAPESLDLAGPARGGIMFGLIALGFAGYLILSRTLEGLAAGPLRVGRFLGAASLTAHSALDGLAIGLGFQASPAAGLVLAAAVLAHDAADGINTVTLSLAASPNARTARLWLAADALAPLVGVALSRLIRPTPASLGAALALFAGIFLHIGASELLPASRAARPGFAASLATLAGLAVIALAVHLAQGL
ncbi:MAG: ZIP family metal transporter, partial [Alphaproteobacteria bacterium]|nr:ZIP family metal transporter [Alphaproteobacteria bacterium]